MRGIWKGGEPYYIDKISGKLITPETPANTTEEIIPTSVHSILYWVDKNNPLGDNRPQNPEADPQFKNWEYSIQEWLKNQTLPKDPIKPTEFDDVHTEKNKPKIKITNPTADKEYDKTERVTIEMTSSGIYPISKIEYFVNGKYMGSSNKSPFVFILELDEIENIKSENELRVVGYDTVSSKGEDVVNFKTK